MRFIQLAAATAVGVAVCACSSPPTSGGFTPVVRTAGPAASAPGKSWLTPAAKGQTLLYVSDVGGVTVYANTGGTNFALVGELFGFQVPAGECTDARGDVFITDETAQVIDEYAHGAITPKAQISDPFGQPLSCAIDRKTGRLAVTNSANPSGAEPGNVVIYPSPSGPPTDYSDATLYVPLFCSFDRKGNLYVTAYDSSYHPVLGEFGKGAGGFTILSLAGGTWFLPSGVLATGTELLIGDVYDRTTHIYEARVSGSTATIFNTIPLSKTQYLAEFTLWGSGSSATILAPDNTYSNVEIYTYPGGSPLGAITSGISSPVGTAISPT
ncbi:MAG TPA: hypothetical protein VMU38_06175 [Candidatus Binatia bacterium]|nr:hypothetical protein [Candidatus Binatia bacterium]